MSQTALERTGNSNVELNANVKQLNNKSFCPLYGYNLTLGCFCLRFSTGVHIHNSVCLRVFL